VPAQTARTESADLARALAFERRAHEQAAQRVEPLPYGFTFLDERLPLVFFANLLWVTAAADDAVGAAQLIADADRALASYVHRWALVEHEPLWRALDDDLAAAGWAWETHVYMTHRHAPDRPPELSGVREVGHDGVVTAEKRFMATQPWCSDPEAGRQVIEHHRRIGELLGERCFAAYAGDEVCAYAKLRHVDGVAQIEDVVVLAAHSHAAGVVVVRPAREVEDGSPVA